MSVFVVSVFAAILSAVADTPDPQPPVVVELFTSQSCSSCPSAEVYFRELAADPDLVALEWHVDYWDELHHGRSGKWKDPFSSPDHTARQRAYNLSLRGRGSVYTPQLVINGVSETVGSKKAEIRKLINGQQPIASIKATAQDRSIRFSVTNSVTTPASDLNAIFVTFRKTAETRVGGGENHGKALREANIVMQFQELTPLSNNELLYTATRPAEGFGCALLLQEKDGGPVRAAAYCPS